MLYLVSGTDSHNFLTSTDLFEAPALDPLNFEMHVKGFGDRAWTPSLDTIWEGLERCWGLG